MGYFGIDLLDFPHGVQSHVRSDAPVDDEDSLFDQGCHWHPTEDVAKYL